MTRSPLVVGAVGAVELIPTVLFALYGGAIADAFDRRRVALLGEIALGGLSDLLLTTPCSRRPGCGCCSWCFAENTGSARWPG